MRNKNSRKSEEKNVTKICKNNTDLANWGTQRGTPGNLWRTQEDSARSSKGLRRTHGELEELRELRPPLLRTPKRTQEAPLVSSGETLSSMILCPPTLGTTSYELKAAATVKLIKVKYILIPWIVLRRLFVFSINFSLRTLRVCWNHTRVDPNINLRAQKCGNLTLGCKIKNRWIGHIWKDNT